MTFLSQTYKPGLRDKEESSTDQPKKDEDEEADDDTPPDIDLFRAIFKNSDSEDSKDESEKEIENSSSDEENEMKTVETQQEDKDQLNPVTEGDFYVDTLFELRLAIARYLVCFRLGCKTCLGGGLTVGVMVALLLYSLR